MEGKCKLCSKEFNTLDEKCKIDFYYKTNDIKITCETCLKKLKKERKKAKKKARNETRKANN
jgi:hypothetical protein